MKQFVFLLLIFVCSGVLKAQSPIPSVPENCQNGIDDDGDGKIDLNDPECFCASDPAEFSLLTNPSFELHNCCPLAVSQTACMENWFQAGYGTTDYMNDWRLTDLNSGVYFYLAEVDQFNGETLKKHGTIHLLNEYITHVTRYSCQNFLHSVTVPR